MKYDLVIAYRICPILSKHPVRFYSDKYSLSKACLESFKKSLEGIRYKMYVILDNCPKEYEQLFIDNFEKEKLELLHTSLGNKGTFKKQIEILSGQNDSDIVYFAEDDYFYIKNLKNMVDMLRRGEADFVTPYEHPGCYTDEHVICNKVSMFEGQRYITVQHACLTFMTTKSNLIRNRRYLRIFSDWFGSDFVVWGCITLGLSFFKHLKVLLQPKKYTLETAKVFGSMALFAMHRFFSNKKYRLCMPIETLATHLEADNLSPGINWDSLIKH